jgi:hypothetical protein
MGFRLNQKMRARGDYTAQARILLEDKAQPWIRDNVPVGFGYYDLTYLPSARNE